jgi:formylglycine-generating enzyme required for sulfatase activity
MVYVPGGRFIIGSDEDISEQPIQQDTIDPFYIGKYTITNQQYKAIMGNNPSHFRSNFSPVEQVNWDDAIEFCQKLSQQTGKQYTLPIARQWEYACRAGTTTPFCFGEAISPDLVNYTFGKTPKGKYRKQTTEVGSFPPNAFGLYDMHGNVWEWCLDKWNKNYRLSWIYGGKWG